MLHDLEGRTSARYCRSDAVWINDVEATRALRPLPLSQFTVHRLEDGRVLLPIFGPPEFVTVEQVARIDGKVIQHTSALAGALA